MGDASADIMSATYRALCEYGYADLTMQRIADASGRSKAALHYHYDTKEDLLDAFLDHVLDEFETRLACEAADPDERLDTFLDAVFDPPSDSTGSSDEARDTADEARDTADEPRDTAGRSPPTEGAGEFPVALLEIKAQAPYHAAYRERLVAMDERMRAIVESAVADGVAAGTFDDCDPAEVARFVVTVINGAHARDVALGESPEQGRALVETYLDRTLGRRGVSA